MRGFQGREVGTKVMKIWAVEGSYKHFFLHLKKR